jgi:hypothetical protein
LNSNDIHAGSAAVSCHFDTTMAVVPQPAPTELGQWAEILLDSRGSNIASWVPTTLATALLWGL